MNTKIAFKIVSTNHEKCQKKWNHKQIILDLNLDYTNVFK